MLTRWLRNESCLTRKGAIMIKFSSMCSGIGAPEQALKNLKVPHKNVFACEIDKYARLTFEANHQAETMYQDMTKEQWDKPEQYADLVVAGIPCQAFSLAGKRLGELDPRGLLFFDFYKYVKNQQPKVFIIENVKGLLSDNKGKTFQNWLQLLGRSVNTQEMMFKHPDSLEYNLHWAVLNSKNFGVPQNRERVFLVGIRNDLPNTFSFPKGWKLTVRLKDILEPVVDEKYYLSDKAVESIILNKSNIQKSSVNPEIANCLQSPGNACGIYKGANFIEVKEATKQGFAIAEPGDTINLSNPNSETRRGCVGKQIANTLDTACNQAVIEPYCVAMRDRNPENPSDRTTGAKTEQRFEPNSQGITNTITSVQKDNLIVEPQLNLIHTMSGGKWDKCNESNRRVYSADGLAPCVTTMQGGNQEPKTIINSRIRRLTPLECFRLQAFPDDFFYKSKYEKVNKHLTIKYDKKWNAELKAVKENQKPKNLESYVLCTTKEWLELVQLMEKFPHEKKEKAQNVNFVIEKLVGQDVSKCATDIIKCTETTEILYLAILKKENQTAGATLDIIMENSSTGQLWRIKSEESLTKTKLYITLILLKQIMTCQTSIYAKTPPNTPLFIYSLIDLENSFQKINILSLQMEFTTERMSDTMLYKQAGNSITVTVIQGIIENLLPIVS